MLNLTLLDICAPALAIGYAIGRIGCQLSGDGDYGMPWDGPWAMAYPDGTVPTDGGGPSDPDLRDAGDGRSSPTSSGGCATAFRPGLLFALYLVLAGAERFLVEFIRRNDDVALGLTQAQLDQRRDDRRRRRLADRQARPWRAASRPGGRAGRPTAT